MKEKWLAVLKAVLIALVIVAGAIALPVLLRPFFYVHIEPLKLQERSGLTVAQIKTAYGEMMDYCIGLSDTFSVGDLSYSQSGADHFADVRKLFLLDLWVLVVATVLLTAMAIWQRKRRLSLAGHTPGFWSAVGLGVVFVTVGGLAAVDFDGAFTVFHKLFFPGETNWVFVPSQDPVIRLLPSVFFRNCAIVILAVILISSACLLTRDAKYRRK